MSHALKRVDNWASKMIGRVGFVFCTVTMMWLILTPIKHLIPQTFILVILVLFASDAPSLGFAVEHVLEDF